MNLLRLPNRHDPLTVEEQEDLDRQLGKMLDENLPSHNFLRTQLENVARLHATLQFYRAMMDTRGIAYREILPERVVRNGIAYLEDWELLPVQRPHETMRHG